MYLDFAQVVTQIFAFLILFWVLKKFGWAPLLKAMEERKEHIRSQFDKIKEQRHEVEKLRDSYNSKLADIENERRLKIQETINEASKMANEIRETAQAGARTIIKKANEEIKADIAEAKNRLKNDMVKISFVLANKILGEEIDETKHKKLIEHFVETVELE